MQGRCEDHLFDRATDLCGRCGGEFCGDCVVYPFGTDRLPLCRPCAVQQSGVRRTAAVRPPLSRRERNALPARRAELHAQLAS